MHNQLETGGEAPFKVTTHHSIEKIEKYQMETSKRMGSRDYKILAKLPIL
jgi:hypothetical protein